MSKVDKKEIERQRDELKEYFRKGKYQAYTILRRVSQSGMSRLIDVYTIIKNQPYRLNYSISLVTGFTRDKKTGSLRVGGGGMDMGFHVVYNTSMALYCIKKYNHDAAYKLKQRWL